MTIVLDTNVLVQMFGAQSPYRSLKQALLAGEIRWIISAPILLEYEEVVVRYADRTRWKMISHALELVQTLHGSVVPVQPSFHFQTITHDQDDNIFADAAITASADYIITHDRHFESLKNAGYKPQPITPEEFIRLYF